MRHWKFGIQFPKFPISKIHKIQIPQNGIYVLSIKIFLFQEFPGDDVLCKTNAQIHFLSQRATCEGETAKEKLPESVDVLVHIASTETCIEIEK